MSRQRSPVPPTLPPKDSSSSLHSSFHSIRPNSRYINADLAEAVRDSVQIRSENSSPVPGDIDFSAPSSTYPVNNNQHLNPNSTIRLVTPPSLVPLVPRRSPSPRINKPNPDIGIETRKDNRMSYIQLQLPSQRIISAENPFETDELDSFQQTRLAGDGNGRHKLARAQTGLAWVADLSCFLHSPFLLSPPDWLLFTLISFYRTSREETVRGLSNSHHFVRNIPIKGPLHPASTTGHRLRLVSPTLTSTICWYPQVWC